MYTLKELLPYVGKKILCKGESEFLFYDFRPDKFYCLYGIYCLDNGAIITEYDKDITKFTIEMSYGKTEHDTEPFFVNGEYINGYTDIFELVTEADIRKRKIKSILDE